MFIEELTESFELNRNPDDAFHMKAYMRNQFEFYGIKAKKRREIFYETLASNKHEVQENCRELVKTMYDLPGREMHLCAMELFYRVHKRTYEYDDIDLIRYLITHNSWWDTVDYIAKQKPT